MRNQDDRSARIDEYLAALKELALRIRQLESTLETAKAQPVATSAAQTVILAALDAKITDALNWQMPEISDLYRVLTWNGGPSDE